MKSVDPSDAPCFTPAQAHLRFRALIGTACRSTAHAPSLRDVGALILGAALVAGCATPSRAPVVDRSELVPKPAVASSAEYIVRPKDSLYAIAWKYNLDYRDIARRNRIEPPYTIYPGQKLVLHGTRPAAAPVTATAETRSSKPVAASRPTAVKNKPVAVDPKPPVATRGTPAPSLPKPAPKPVATPTPQPKPQPTAARKSPPSPTGRGGWRWPVEAQPARGFGRGNKGFDYVLASGQQVVAAAAGQVVYAGPGLGGFRHLVIVQHPGKYMSAYNVNVAPSVAEGSRIASGGKICAIGSGTPASRRLHFEIRRDGTPVNPASIIGRR